jgi:hypothetical protein
MAVRYEVEGDDLCIRIPLDAIAALATADAGGIVTKVRDKSALAMSLGRELCECEDAGGSFYLNRPLDDALERVIESDDKSLQYTHDEK